MFQKGLNIGYSFGKKGECSYMKKRFYYILAPDGDSYFFKDSLRGNNEDLAALMRTIKPGDIFDIKGLGGKMVVTKINLIEDELVENEEDREYEFLEFKCEKHVDYLPSIADFIAARNRIRDILDEDYRKTWGSGYQIYD